MGGLGVLFPACTAISSTLPGFVCYNGLYKFLRMSDLIICNFCIMYTKTYCLEGRGDPEQKRGGTRSNDVVLQVQSVV